MLCTHLCASDRFPFYFELKIAFVIWLLSPYTKGSSVLYRKFVHPTLSNKEKVCPHPRPFPARPGRDIPMAAATSLSHGWQSPAPWGGQCLCLLPHLWGLLPPLPQEIDEYITQARDKSYETMMRVGKRGLNLAANAAVTAAAKVRRGWAQPPRAPILFTWVPSGPLGVHLGDFGLCSSRLRPCFFPHPTKGKTSQHHTLTCVSTPPLPPALLVCGGDPRARGCCPKSSGASACKT